MDEAPPSEEFSRYHLDGRDRDTGDEMRAKQAKRIAYMLRSVEARITLRGLDILDAGCGEGQLLSMLPKGNRLFGFDASEQRLDVRLAGDRADLSVQDIYRTTFPDRKFDVVFCSEVLEHLERPSDALAELARICKPSGMVCFSVPYDENIQFETCVHCGKPTPLHGHLHRFDVESAKRVVPPSLKILEIRRVCNNAIHMRFFRWPFFIYETLDYTATRVFKVSKPRWIVATCRRESSQ